MTLRDLQEVYSDELIIVELEQPACNQVFNGIIADIPKNLLNRKIAFIDTDFSYGAECSWLIVNIEEEKTLVVNIEKEKTLEDKFDFSNMYNIKDLERY